MGKKDGKKNRSKSRRFESEETLSAANVAGYLEGLARGLREGNIALGEQSDAFTAVLSGDIDLEVDARHRKKKSRVELTLSFRTEASENSDKNSGEDETVAEEDKDVAEAATIPDEMSF